MLCLLSIIIRTKTISLSHVVGGFDDTILQSLAVSSAMVDDAADNSFKSEQFKIIKFFILDSCGSYRMTTMFTAEPRHSDIRNHATMGGITFSFLLSCQRTCMFVPAEPKLLSSS